jgi:hypothetical protein
VPSPHTAGFTQLPAVQVAPPVQALPHVPQLELSVWVFTQALLQSVCPEPHTQPPVWQVEPEGQILPQVPQLLLSVWVFTQVLLQAD